MDSHNGDLLHPYTEGSGGSGYADSGWDVWTEIEGVIALHSGNMKSGVESTGFLVFDSTVPWFDFGLRYKMLFPPASSFELVGRKTEVRCARTGDYVTARLDLHKPGSWRVAAFAHGKCGAN